MKNYILKIIAITFLVLFFTSKINAQNSVFRNGVFLYEKADSNPFSNKYKEISTLNLSDGRLILVKKINLSDTRRNPDNSIFYKTTFALIIDKTDEVKINEIETSLFTDKNGNFGITPCLLFDPQKNVVTIFASGKNSQSYNYAMEGYAFRIDLANKSWTREQVFDNANWGFFSFFGGSDNGNPILWHFSFAGYYAMKSSRNSNGTWSNINQFKITPDNVSKQYVNHKNILVTSSANTDQMTNSTSSYYENSNSYNQLTSNQIAIGATVVLGTILREGAKLLFKNTGSDSVESYSNNSNQKNTNSDLENETTKSDNGKHIEFREDETRNCGNNVKITDYKVYKNGEKYSTISVSSFNGYWSTSCPNGGFLPDKAEQSRLTLKQFLIRQYESGTSNADSYTLTTK